MKVCQNKKILLLYTRKERNLHLNMISSSTYLHQTTDTNGLLAIYGQQKKCKNKLRFINKK